MLFGSHELDSSLPSDLGTRAHRALASTRNWQRRAAAAVCSVALSRRRLRWRRPNAGRIAQLAGCEAFHESFLAVFARSPRAPRSPARLWAQPWSCAQRRTEVGPQGKAGARRGPCGPRAHRLPWGGLPEARPCGDARFTSGRRLLLAAAPSSTDQLVKSLARCLSTVLVISVFPSGSPRVEIGFFSREKI